MGSEMCIRDSPRIAVRVWVPTTMIFSVLNWALKTWTILPRAALSSGCGQCLGLGKTEPVSGRIGDRPTGTSGAAKGQAWGARDFVTDPSLLQPSASFAAPLNV